MKKAATKCSASLLFNNLASNGKHIAYAHGREVIIIPDSTTSFSGHPSVTRVPDKDQSVVQQVRWVAPPDVPTEMLVIASSKSLQMYSADGKHFLYLVPFVRSDDKSGFFRGIAACNAAGTGYVFAGCSNGEICRLPVTGSGEPSFGKYIMHPAQEQCTCVSDLAAASLPGGTGILAVASSGEGGCAAILLMDVVEAEAPKLTATFPSDIGSMCTSLRIRQSLLLCAFSTGQVRMYDLEAKVLTAVMTAHARWINALEVHPSKDTFATASEDAYVGVWRLPEQGGHTIKLVTHYQAQDCTLTGVTFCGGASRDSVGATAYDVDYVMAWGTD
eukprot:CAMPEP_0119309530 /NCGR_PEP_ID=MMETSP1333-20130426/15819_1 /TAXON_ID=418940 /ORGANISM="Scyphosphaera apsteinii, Strain RCC1455" /LENGTH=330 /DNA_ID=CAMNT_0007313523 /DNA_START=56 /DNA_END=1048 /DNA_ORIENTATION=+